MGLSGSYYYPGVEKANQTVGAVGFKEIPDDNTPPAQSNILFLYVKESDGRLYYKDENGNESLVGAGSGGSASGSAGGDLTGSYPNPSVVKITDEVGTSLSLGVIANGEYVRRSGSFLLGSVPSGSGDVVGPGSSISGNLAAFGSPSGKLIIDSGVSSYNIPTSLQKEALSGSSGTPSATNKFITQQTYAPFTASINTFSQSVNLFSASLNTFSASQLAEMANLKAFTGSVKLFSASVSNFTASINAFTASVNQTFSTLASYTASLSASIQSNGDARYVLTSSYRSYTSSLNSFTASQLTLNANLNSFTASTVQDIAELSSYDSSVATFTASLSASVQSNGDLRYTFSSSFNSFTASQQTINENFNSFSTSFSESIKSIGDSRYVLTSSYGVFTASQNNFNANVNVFTASQNTFNSNLNSFTASLPTLVNAISDGRYVTLLNSFSGSVTLVAGPNVTINSESGVISISGSGGGGSITGSAAGDLSGTFPSASVIAITYGSSRYPIGSFSEGQYLRLVGGNIVGGDPSGGSGSTGDVEGAASSYTSELVKFNGTTGKIITGSGYFFGPVSSGQNLVLSGTSISGTNLDERYTFTSSYNIFQALVNSFTASLSSSIQNNGDARYLGTASFNQFSASINSFTQSTNVTVDSLKVFTASQTTFNSLVNSFTASFSESIKSIGDSRYVLTSSYGVFTGTVATFTASVNSFTASQITTNASLITYTGSVNLFTASINNFTASLYSYTASLNAFTASVKVFTASQISLNSLLNTFTASVNSFTAAFTASVNSISDGRYVNSINAVSGNLTFIAGPNITINSGSGIIVISGSVSGGGGATGSAAGDLSGTFPSASVIAITYANNRYPIGAFSEGEYLRLVGGNIVGGDPSGGSGSVGDVEGPASSYVNELVKFNGTTGKIITGSGYFFGPVSDGQNLILSGTSISGTNLDERYTLTSTFVDFSQLINSFTSSFSASVASIGDSRYVLTSSYGVFTASINSFTASINTFTASQLTTNTQLRAYTGSMVSYTASMSTFTTSLKTFTASQITTNTSLRAYTGSMVAYTASMNLFTASVKTFTSSFYAFSASVKTFTSSFYAFSASVNTFTASQISLNANLNNFTASFSSSVQSIGDIRYVFTSSFTSSNVTTSLNGFSGSITLIAGPNITINSGSGIISITGSSGTVITGSAVVAAGNIIALVTGSGDDNNILRSPVLISGDYSSQPFKTLEGLRASLPISLKEYSFTANLGVGEFTGTLFNGLIFRENNFKLVGTRVLATLISGSNDFTAGSATTSDSIQKNSASADWFSGSMSGLFVRLKAGDGYNSASYSDNIATIEHNTANFLYIVPPIVGISSASQFEIFNVGTKILHSSSQRIDDVSFTLGFTNVAGNPSIENIEFTSSNADYGLFTKESGVNLTAVKFNAGNHLIKNSISSQIVGAYFTSSGYLLVQNSNNHQSEGIVACNGRYELDNFGEAIVNHYYAENCVGNAFKARKGRSLTVGIHAESNTATPVYMRNIGYTTIGSYGLEGNNPSASYGLDVGEGGSYSLNGGILSGGTSAILLGGKNVSWSTLSTKGNVRRGTSILHWSGNRVYELGKLELAFDPDDTGDELITIDGTFGGQTKNYGFDYELGDAFNRSVTAAGSDAAGATTLAYRTSIITAGAAGTGVKLRASYTGATGKVYNKSGSSKILYAVDGTGVINGGSAGAGISFPNNSIAIWQASGVDAETNIFTVVIVSESSGVSGSVATDSIWQYKGDLVGATGNGAAIRIPSGSSGQVLSIDAAETSGHKWITVAGAGALQLSGNGTTVTGTLQTNNGGTGLVISSVNKILKTSGSNASMYETDLNVGSLNQFSGYRADTIFLTSSYLVEQGNSGKIFDCSGSSIALTMSNDLFVNDVFTIRQSGTGQVAIVAEAGGSIVNPDSQFKTRTLWSEVAAVVRANTSGSNAQIVLTGDTAV